MLTTLADALEEAAYGRVAQLGPGDDGIWFWWDDGSFILPVLQVHRDGCRTLWSQASECVASSGSLQPQYYPTRGQAVDDPDESQRMASSALARLEGIRSDVLDTLRRSLAVAQQNQPVPRYPEEQHPSRPPFGSYNSTARGFESYLQIFGEPVSPANLIDRYDESLGPALGFNLAADSEYIALRGSWELSVIFRHAAAGPRVVHVLISESEAG